MSGQVNHGKKQAQLLTYEEEKLELFLITESIASQFGYGRQDAKFLEMEIFVILGKESKVNYLFIQVHDPPAQV